jgi:hypothetical protein
VVCVHQQRGRETICFDFSPPGHIGWDFIRVCHTKQIGFAVNNLAIFRQVEKVMAQLVRDSEAFSKRRVCLINQDAYLVSSPSYHPCQRLFREYGVANLDAEPIRENYWVYWYGVRVICLEEFLGSLLDDRPSQIHICTLPERVSPSYL